MDQLKVSLVSDTWVFPALDSQTAPLFLLITSGTAFQNAYAMLCCRSLLSDLSSNPLSPLKALNTTFYSSIPLRKL